MNFQIKEKPVELRDACGIKRPTEATAIAHLDSEERYRRGNGGREKRTMSRPRHQKRTPEQVLAHNAKRAEKRERRKADRAAAGIQLAF